jgi:hypothetical protein
MTFPSESQSISLSFMQQTGAVMREMATQIAAIERERCAQLIEQLRDGTEDQVQKDLFNDCATAIRRMPHGRY